MTRPQVAAAVQSASDVLFGKGSRTYDQSRVRVVYYEGASSFGGGAAHVDNGECAAICSLAVGAPVRVQWMRWDEHGWDNYGPATLWDVKGGVDAKGKLVAWDATSFGMGSYTKTPSEAMIGQAIPTPGAGPADTTYSGTQYDIPNRRIVGKTVPTLNNYFKVSTLRAPNAMQTCFGNEQVIDQLAYLAGQDPYQFRLNNISTAPLGTGVGQSVANAAPGQWQWRDALNAVAKAANWQPRVTNSVKQTGLIRKGRGIAMGGFANSQAANVADVEVNMKTPFEAWDRRLHGGVRGDAMYSTLNTMGHDASLKVFADWTDRIAKGEVPPAPERPKGPERNVVVTLWDVGDDHSFMHDEISTNKNHPTVNAGGPVYAVSAGHGQLVVLDPKENSTYSVDIPTRAPRETVPSRFPRPSPAGLPSSPAMRMP